MVDQTPILRAKELIQGCIELLEGEQQTFLILRLRTDLEAAIDSLGAIQTVALPPFRKNSVKNLAEIDDGEPSAYDVTHDGTTIILDAPPGEFPRTLEVKIPPAELNVEADDEL